MIFQKYNIFFELILFFSSFCYIKFFNFGTSTDLQLYYFIICLLFLIITIKKIDKTILISTTLLLITLIFNLFIDYKDFFSFFKGSYSYISFVVVFYSIYKLCKKITIKKIEKRIKFYFILWNIAGIIQLFDNSLVIFWRNRITIEGGRGSISFGTEPAYYVFFLILSSMILYSINKKNKYYFCISLFFSGILAKSFTGMFYLLIIIVLIYLNKRNILKMIPVVSVLIITLIIFGYNIPQNAEYRILKLLRGVVRNPFLLLIKDGSARTRIIHIFFSFKGSLENLLLPNGFSRWYRYMITSLIEYKDFFMLTNEEILILKKKLVEKIIIKNEINTMVGGIIYELGFIGICFYYFIYRICLNKKVWLIIMILSIDGLNIANPHLAILLGINYFLYKSKLQEKANENKIFNNNSLL